MIKEVIFHQLSRAINRVLATDPLALTDLKKHKGKSLLIELEPMKLNVYVLFTETGIQLKNQHDQTANVRLSGKPSALLKFAKSPDQTKMLMDETVSLSGEIDLLLKLKQWATTTQLDIEALVADVIGDTAANRLGLLAHHFSQRLRGSMCSLKHSTTLYLQEESRLLPSSSEVEQFVKDVNQLRQDLERATARSQQLSRGVTHV
jgi:ubiquinone biosynthesis protein UbiJ